VLSADELATLLADMESDRVERKETAADTDKLSQAVCVFANDLPGHGKPGVLFIGVTDDGRHAGLPITDELLRRLADLRDQGNILPPPSMSVRKVSLPGGDLAVVEVQPSSAPPT
jgi:ATP-dependent DNA helicase RecG